MSTRIVAHAENPNLVILHDDAVGYWVGYGDHSHVCSDGTQLYIMFKTFGTDLDSAIEYLNQLPHDYATR